MAEVAPPPPPALASPESRWAQPRLPPPLALGKLRDYTRGVASFAGVPIQPVLSTRRNEASGLPAGGGMPSLAGDGARVGRTLGTPPHSARERLGGPITRPPPKGLRTRSVDAPASPRRGTVGGGGGASPAQLKALRAAGGDGAFLRALLEGAAGGGIGEALLARLECEAGASRRQAEVVRLLRAIGAKEPRADAPQGDAPQLAAQVAHLEKKIARLREKVKRRIREVHAASAEDPQKAHAALDLDSASVEELAAEAAELRAERARLRREGSPVSGRGRRGGERQEVQAARDLAAEREAAEERARTSQRLAEQVEERLREMVLARESEQIRLETEQELLRRLFEEQALAIEEAERDMYPVDPQAAEALRRQLAKVERLVAAAQRRMHASEDTLDVHDATEAAPAAGPSHLSLVKAAPHGAPPHEAKARAQLPRPEGETLEELEEATRTAEAELAATAESIQRVKAEEALRLDGLHAELAQAREQAAALQQQRRRQLAEEAKRCFDELTRAAGEELPAPAGASAAVGKDSAAVKAAQRELQQLAKALQEKAEAERLEAEAKLQHLESQLESVQQEMLLTQERHSAVERRERDLRGRAYLALRPRSYRRRELVHYLSRALGVPCERFHVLEESFLPDGTPCSQLVDVRGGALVEPEEQLDALVRPLPELRHGASQLADAEDSAAEESEGQAAEEEEAAESSQGGTGEEEHAGVESTAAPRSNGAADVRVVLEVVAHDAEPRGACGAGVAYRLVDLVRAGGSLLEDMAVLGACSLRGGADFGAEGAPWSPEDARLLARAARTVAGRRLIISGYGVARPLAVKLVAVDNAREEDFVLCLDAADVQALLAASRESTSLPELGPELFEALLETLHVVSCPDGRPALVAVHAVGAPRTVLNEPPARTTAPARKFTAPPATSATSTALSISDLAVSAREAPRSRAPALAAAAAPLPRQLVPRGPAPGPPALRPQRVCLEDALLLEDRFFLLSVYGEDRGGELRVRLQEAGTCRAFEVVLPGHGHAQQLRALAQAHEFGDMTLLVSAEDVVQPAGLVIRVARSSSAQPLAWRDPHQRVYWLSRASPGEGGIPQHPPAAAAGAASAIVSVVPWKHREHLLDFVRAEPGRGTALPGQGWQLASCGAGTGPAGVAAEPAYGQEGSRTGKVLRDSSVPRAQQDTNAAAVRAQLIEASMRSLGRPLLKMGHRFPAPGLGPAGSALCVVTVREHAEPYLHFVVMAYEVGSCCSWALLLTSLDVFKALEISPNAEARDVALRRSFARDLVQHCELLPDGAGSVCLALAAPQRQAPRGAASSAVRALENGGGSGQPSAWLLAPQVLTQEQAVQCCADGSRFCMLRAERKLAGRPFDVRIIDEPDAPNAPFQIHNFLVIAQDTARGLYFSLRLNDKVLQHPLLPEEQHLVEPEHRTALLERVICSLDVCRSYSGSSAGGAEGGSGGGERLVMQPFRTGEVAPLVPDGKGTLRPRLLGPEPLGSTSAGSQGALLAIESGTSNSREGDAQLASTTTPAAAAPPPPEDARQRSSAAVHIGGCLLEGPPPVLEAGQSAVERRARLGGADLELSLRTDADAHTLTLCRVDDDATVGRQVLEVQIPAHGEPTRIYLEHRTLGNASVVVAMAQQAFPHEVQAIVFDAASHEEADLVLSDGAIVPFVERSARERLCDAVEQILKFGALGPTSLGDCRPVASGREMFPSDLTSRALQCHVPVVQVNFSQLAHEVPSELVGCRELVFSCSRYVLNSGLLATAAAPGKAPPGVDLESTPLLKLSLSKKSYCQDITFSIELAGDHDSGSHMVHVRDKLAARPLGMYAEIQKVGPLRLLVLILDDCAPRALRVAVVEPVSGWAFQLVLVERAAAAGAPPYLAASAPRHELLQLFRRRLSSRRGAAPKAPALAAGAQQAAGSPSSGSAASGQLLALPPPPRAQQREQQHAEARPHLAGVLHREARFLADSDDVALITASYEVGGDGTLAVKATLSHPGSAKESQLLLVSPALDRLLAACGLPAAAALEPRRLEEEPAKGRVAALFLGAVEVSPSLEMELRLDRLPRATAAQEHGRPKEQPGGGPAHGARAAAAGAAAAEAAPLECPEDRLLGRAERRAPGEEAARPPTAAGEAAAARAPPGLRVEVFDGADCVQALFHSTNLRVRVTDVATGRSATRDLHEGDLEPWLEQAGAGHLLCASREADLVEFLLQHTSLGEPGRGSAGCTVVLDSLHEDALAAGRFAAGLLESAQVHVHAPAGSGHSGR